MAVSDYSGTPADNTSINGIDISEGCAPSGINNAIRQMMADVFLDRVPAGVVLPYGAATAPDGWALCYGQAVSRTTYATLFSLYGTTYGAGDGSTTFNLPDMRGRAVFGKDNMGDTSANRITGAVSGMDGDVLGETGGHQATQQHTHTTASHSHGAGSLGTNTTGNHNHGGGQAANRDRADTGSGGGWAGAAGNTSSAGNHSHTISGSTATATVTVNNSGTGDSQNMPPAIILTWIVKLA